MFTHIIFDLDGTLLNTIDDLADAGNHVCTAHGWPTHTVDEFKRMVGNGIPTLVKRFTPEGLGEDGLAQALAEFSACYDAHKEDKTAPYPGVPELLAALKGQGVRMAVLSNKAHALAGPVVEHYFPGVFDVVQGALPDAPVKPDPTLLHRLMGQMGAKPETTLFVGDSNVDVQTGKNGGLTSVGVLWGFRGREELEGAGADYVIERPEELLVPSPDQRQQIDKKAHTLPSAGCVAAWMAAAFFACLEATAFLWFLELLPDVIHYGYDEPAGYNLHLAEDFWEARMFMVLAGVPLIVTLVVAIRSTIKLRRQGKKREHPMLGKW